MVFVTIALENEGSALPCDFRFLFLSQAGRGRFEMRRYKIKSKIRHFEFPLLDHSLNILFLAEYLIVSISFLLLLPANLFVS